MFRAKVLITFALVDGSARKFTLVVVLSVAITVSSGVFGAEPASVVVSCSGCAVPLVPL